MTPMWAENSDVRRGGHWRTIPYSSLAQYIADRWMPEPNSGCWLWLGTLDQNGYGTCRHQAIRLAGLTTTNAHRVSFILSGGVIPPGHELDHLCRVRCCINPAHLEAVTHAENMRRGMSTQRVREYFATRTHCKRGHALIGDNIFLRADGRRQCQECRRMTSRAFEIRNPGRLRR